MAEPRQSRPGGSERGEFAEAPAWHSVGSGWRPLFGSFQNLGFSFEWHDFLSPTPLDWSRSFHPGSLELCLNLDGVGELDAGGGVVEVGVRMYAFYYQGDPPLRATRRSQQRHRFITVEFSREFLTHHLGSERLNLHPLPRRLIEGQATVSEVAPAERVSASLLQLVESLRNCPVFQPAHTLWFRSKAIELAAQLFFRPAGGDLFCTRAQRVARDRVARVRAVLLEEMASPPTLEALGKRVGCSPYYLSRLFSQESGMTIQQYLRQVRLERAAELLQSGRCNVTEAALEVGYNSLSHFSSAFHQLFGCCPGLYPLRTNTQIGRRGPEPE